MAKLYFYYSAMNAGKSTMLLQSAYNYKERNLDTLILVPKIGIKSKKKNEHIHSRIGLSTSAIVVCQEDNIFDLIKSAKIANPNIACILIDEAQFLTKKQVFGLAKAVDQLNLPALTYGIRSDFQAEPFEGSIYLLALADHLVELKTICHCGSKATMNLRIDDEGNAIKQGQQILIGGNEHYIATCRKHFNLNDPGKSFKLSQKDYSSVTCS